MLIIEIDNQDINEIGGCPEGRYRYVVKVNRREIAFGEVRHDRKTHWSLLLAEIAKSGRDREFEANIGQSPEDFMASHKESP